MDTFLSMQGLFPLTSPVPTASSVADLINLEHLSLEHDLLKNPDQPGRWASYISTITDEVLASELSARGKATELEQSVLGAKLSTSEGRLGLQRLTDIYERAIAAEPKSFKLWKEYLAMRAKYVLGTPASPIKLNAPKKKRGDDGQGRSMVEFLEAGKGQIDKLDEGERDIDSGWEGGLDGVVGWEEWRSLAAVHERALMWLPTVSFDSFQVLQPKLTVTATAAPYLALIPLHLHPPILPGRPLPHPRPPHLRPRPQVPPELAPPAHLARLPRLGRTHRWRDLGPRLASLP